MMQKPLIKRIRAYVKHHIPWPLVKLGRRVRNFGPHQCLLCGSRVRRFLDTYIPADRCPVCLADGHVRLIWLYLSRHTPLFDGRHLRVLHMAPECATAERFLAAPALEYTPADYDTDLFIMPWPMMSLDLTEPLAPELRERFDVVICNHVFEHIPNDRAAMATIYDLLVPSGWAMLMAPDPHKLAVTIEDPDAPPEERARRFGQSDHVRLYGADYFDRLREMGFLVEIWTAGDNDPAMCAAWRLDPAEQVIIAHKPSADSGEIRPFPLNKALRYEDQSAPHTGLVA